MCKPGTHDTCQALVCGTDCQLLIRSGVVTADSIDFHISMIIHSAAVSKCQHCVRICVKKGVKVAMSQENNDLINDAAHGICGSCAVGQISLQGSQPVLNTAARISAPGLAGTSYKTHRAVRRLVCCPPDRVNSRSAQECVCRL